MAKAIEKQIQIGIFDDQFEVMDPDDELTFSVEELTLVHVRTEDEFVFPVNAVIYRKVPLIEGCSVDEFCTCYGETCDTLYIPPGKYEIELCDDNSAKYAPDGVYNVSIILEPVSASFALAEQLNANC